MSAIPLGGLELIIVVVVVTLGALLKAWISLREADLRERSMTERFTRALEDSSPQQRPAIIRAMGPPQDGTPGETGRAREDDAEPLPERTGPAWLRGLWRRLGGS